MKSKIITDENGITTSNNWMLEEIIESFEKIGLNNGINDDLIKEIYIQKIKYGQICMNQLMATTEGFDRLEMSEYHKELDNELEKKILELKK